MGLKPCPPCLPLGGLEALERRLDKSWGGGELEGSLPGCSYLSLGAAVVFEEGARVQGWEVWGQAPTLCELPMLGLGGCRTMAGCPDTPSPYGPGFRAGNRMKG